MNKTKRILIIVAVVLNFASIALNLYLGIVGLLVKPVTQLAIFTAIYEFLGVAAYIAASALLIYSIAGKGNMFRTRYGCYMTAVVITFILDLFSVSSVLLFITLFLPDIVWVRPHDDVYFEKAEEVKEKDNSEMLDKERERKIENLRKLRDEGKITEEEFEKELFKLL